MVIDKTGNTWQETVMAHSDKFLNQRFAWRDRTGMKIWASTYPLRNLKDFVYTTD